MSEKIIHKIFLKEDGSFTNEMDKIFYLGVNEPIRLQLTSKLFKTNVPILLTNLNQKMKSKSKILNQLEIKQERFITRKELEDKYKVIYGEFDDEGNWNCEIIFDSPLTYFCQVVFFSPLDTASEKFRVKHFGRAEWFVVEPQIQIKNKVISPRALIVQTLIAKCMGPITEWEPLIKAQTELNYNAFHFTPVQQFGASDSAYSISDQLGFDSKIFPNMTADEAFNTLCETLQKFKKKYNCLFMIDIVPNHTSFDSPWLLECPDAAYNTKNTPALTSAYLLDEAIQQLSVQIMNGERKEFPERLVRTEDDINKIMNIIVTEMLPERKIHEHFMFNIGKVMEELRKYVKKTAPEVRIPDQHLDYEDDVYGITIDDAISMIFPLLEKHQRNLGASPFGATLDMKPICDFLIKNAPKVSYEAVQIALKRLNPKNEEMARGYINEGLGAIRGNLMHERVYSGNHKITETNQLLAPYFTVLKDGTKCANNGWMYVQDINEVFADCQHFHYLRRHVVQWGDLVKLRYGNSKEDCPYLWKRMKKHVQMMAKAFDGFRIDNSHSTPMHVCEYFIRKARKVNPSFYVFAELFTESVETDALYQKRVGFNSLVREVMRTVRPGDFANDIYKYSGGMEFAVGSLDAYFEKDDKTGQLVHILKPKHPNGMYYDLTHDNMSFNNTRTFMDTLPTAALLCLSSSLLATTKGFDELYEVNPSVVSERRKYAIENDFEGKEVKSDKVHIAILSYKPQHGSSLAVKGTWDNWTNNYKMDNVGGNLFKVWIEVPAGKHEYKFLIDDNWHLDALKDINENGNHVIETSGSYKLFKNITPARKALNLLHQRVCEEYPEFFVYQPADDVITINRENKSRTNSYVLIARTAFRRGPSHDVNFAIDLPGRLENIEMIYHLEDYIDENTHDENYLCGMKGRMRQETDLSKFANIFITSNPANKEMKYHSLRFHCVPPSFVCVLKVSLDNKQVQAVQKLEELTKVDVEDLTRKLASKWEVTDISYILFSCSSEEKERSNGARDVYNLPLYGSLPYAGFGGVFRMVRTAQIRNDLSIPLFSHLRHGNWLLDYYLTRTEGIENFKDLHQWCKTQFDLLKVIPRHLIPRYFVKVINIIWKITEIKALEKVPKQVENLKKFTFFRSLVLACYQFVADIPSGKVEGFKETLCAGLPHFATGWMRCWGRDTFISFKGNLLIPGLHDVARNVILMFAKTLRHGLIPNLLDRGISPRYNCRDATWWFIRAIGDYISFTNEAEILQEKVKIIFLSDDQKEHEEKVAKKVEKYMTLEEIVFEIFQKHAAGINYREWNAGHQIDSVMKHEGFNISLCLDEETGFIVGGNQNNCLTWMDKMGSSEKVGNKGIPGTSRDGAPIEMTALLKHTLTMIINLHEQKKFKFDRVVTKSGKEFTFTEWASKIDKNFEKYYWIPEKEEEFKEFHVDPEQVFCYGIYKDTIMCQNPRAGYKLRPNACIAISVAPELFSINRAFRYLLHVEKVLIERDSLGVKTLDPREEEYISYYDNENESQFKTAQGFSYHNGPEWVWVYGMFLKAGISAFSNELSFPGLMSFLSKHKSFLQKNDWFSLPEVTNQNGEYNRFSCPAQSWSIAVLLEAYYEAKLTLKQSYF